jgi:hypothetical protein
MRATKLRELGEMAAKLLETLASFLRGRSGATFFGRSGDFGRR